MYTCTVCGDKFTDTWEHVMLPTNPTGPKDELHAMRFKELESGVEPKVKRCFCGGTVTTVGIGEDGWSTNCNDCDMLYDED